MKFSVIIPVYNVEKYLAKCLDSVLSQTYDDYEIIAVNDGSLDQSVDILNEYRTKTNKLIIINQENKGLGGARNTGIQNALGEYLVFLDSDDYINTNMLEMIHKYISNYNLDILAFDCLRVTEEGKVLEQVTLDAYVDEYTMLTKEEFLLLEPTACTKVYKRNLYINNNIYFPEKLWYEDLATVFKLVPCTESIGYLKKAFYNYVQRPSSITHSTNVDRMMEIIIAFDGELSFYKENHLINEYYDELEWNCILHVIYYSAFRLLTCGYNKKQMIDLYNYTKVNFPKMEDNKYLKENIQTRHLMHHVINKQFLRFYFKTGLQIKIIQVIKKILMFMGIDNKR